MRIVNGRVLRGGVLERGELCVEGGRIVEKCEGRELDVGGLMVLPGYIDLQVNGGYGVDLAVGAERVGELARRLPLHGVTAFLAAVVSSVRSEYRRVINMLQPRGVSGGATLLGVHLEGPFFSEVYGGAHGGLAVVGGDIHGYYGTLSGVRMVTVAPEVEGVMAAIGVLVERKVVVALGHSGAALDVVERAVEKGARVVTHLFNAMRPFHHRAPGLIDTALLGGMSYTLICDGVHVGAKAVELAWRLNPGGMMLVSDVMAGLGMPDGRYTLGGADVEVSGAEARVIGKRVLAGSVVGLDEGVRNLQRVTGCSVAQAVETVTARPAALLGLAGKKGTLAVGADADIILVDDALRVRGAFVGGERLF